MLRQSGEYGAPGPPRGGPGAHRAHLLALVASVACAALLPLAVASAGSVRDRPPAVASSPGAGGDERLGTPVVPAPGDAVRPGAVPDDGEAPVDSPGRDGKEPVGGPARPQAPAGPGESPEPAGSGALGLGGGTAVRCGPDLTSPGGVEAQTCVLAQGADIWARTYYRNATGDALTAVLSLMGPGGRTVRMHCAVGAEDAPAMCETPRGPARAALAAHTAVAEFAAPGGSGPLLLRTGSN
ncbi:hypothetical protein AB0M97_26195 [Streptomyces sp. NPDC051207]|uniref:hypothetical protein n=1 Tax=Streptomyces sp. NPDC051207 TaxID=3154641 RepID=UPI00342919D7